MTAVVLKATVTRPHDSSSAPAAADLQVVPRETSDPLVEEGDTLTRQLEASERMALLAGLPLAAQWIRDHSECAVVWVKDGTGEPHRMLTWVAKLRGLEPVVCSVCSHVATEVGSLHPLHLDWDRCAAHRPPNSCE